MNKPCFNRKPFVDFVMVQSGWLVSGARRMKELPNNMSKDCRNELRATDPGCAGCKWIASTLKEPQ